MKEACGTAHMKSILATGELGSLENVYKVEIKIKLLPFYRSLLIIFFAHKENLNLKYLKLFRLHWYA
jgi:hypothetical protein